MLSFQWLENFLTLTLSCRGGHFETSLKGSFCILPSLILLCPLRLYQEQTLFFRRISGND